MKRQQFSSCDECRRSRVACDALTRRKATGNESTSCTRCHNRHRECTFKWMQDVKTTPSSAKRKGRRRPSETPSDLPFPRDIRSVDASVEESSNNGTSLSGGWQESMSLTSPTTESVPYDYVSPLFTVVVNSMNDPTGDFLSDVDSQWLSILYKEGFDAVFGSWMGRYGNPFVFGQDSIADKYVSIPDLCCQLDRWMAESSSVDAQSTASGQQESERDRQTQQSLERVIASFAVRWLPLTSQSQNCTRMTVIQALWRRSRRDMLRVINRPSYRSIITLLLFALTSIPDGISEEEEVDGISGQSCVHAALQQIQTLRARQKNLQFSGSKVSPSSMKVQAICQTPESSIGTSSFINAESTVYWTALTFDTSASLTLNCRSFLSSGLFGFEAELPWRLVRTCSKMFDEEAQHWGPSSLDMTDERANQIIGAGTSWKLLGWKLTAIFKEALRDGHHESEVRKAYTAVVDSIKEFNTIYRPHLDACEKRMQFLGQKTKLRWYSLMLHYHLSILMFVDIIEVTNRFDLLADFAIMSSEAETTVMNTLAFGLHNTYTVDTRPYSESNHPTPESNGVSSFGSPITVPVVSIDPYPHHVVAGIALVRKAVDRDFRIGKITKESYKSLVLTLERTLNHLPQCSKSVQAAKSLFSSKVPDEALSHHQDPYVVLQAQFGEWFATQ